MSAAETSLRNPFVLTYGRPVNASPGRLAPGPSRSQVDRARPGRRRMSTRNLNHRAAEAGGFFV
jgi:hypothetical protein